MPEPQQAAVNIIMPEDSAAMQKRSKYLGMEVRAALLVERQVLAFHVTGQNLAAQRTNRKYVRMHDHSGCVFLTV